MKSLRLFSSYKDGSFKFADITVRLAPPERLKPKPNADALQFGKEFTDHLLKLDYHERAGGWQKPVICPYENISLDPAAKVFHYAIELFEGMKAYRGVDDKIRLFRPHENMARMNKSAETCGLPQFDSVELIKCISKLILIDQEWVPHSNTASLYIRPTIIATEPALGIKKSESALLYVICTPVGAYFKKLRGNMKEGISLYADPKYIRAWPGGAGDRKLGANYGPTIRVLNEAEKKGYQQVLWLFGEDYEITEVGAMNLFFVIHNSKGKKELLTPPLNGLILPGITRDSVLGLAREWDDIIVTERKITMPEIIQLSKENKVLECLGAGTASVLSPVNRINFQNKIIDIPTTEQEDGLFPRLFTAITDIQYGKVDHPWGHIIE